ncbi:MAG: hypothetical protein D6674_04535 [Acidobacteria bacterium]|nr:MAG: hypothetical protein D6674_04535 [Acidobacteriota bacterium]
MELMKLHPPVVHFAIAFPVFMFITDLYYRWKKKPPDGLHVLLTYISTLALLGGTGSGIIAHKPIEEELHTIGVFEFHESLGIFLSLLFLGLAFVRFYLDKTKGGMRLRDIYTLLLAVGVILLFLQGRWGGMIVYDYLLKTGL